ncbi:hypothetical protein RUMCAL_01811 [Ruminococcus callidus ATCC 27760]|uniref:Uncharacterized protein n=1 Tax=Ruminococcus callidus ATCC 27760 TaxID=411473 RepID=U2M6H7_9FIRM|nr:hypothetical protein RUMCAL_01811 [Ruminococcus callidus ATCC 27760]
MIHHCVFVPIHFYFLLLLLSITNKAISLLEFFRQYRTIFMRYCL